MTPTGASNPQSHEYAKGQLFGQIDVCDSPFGVDGLGVHQIVDLELLSCHLDEVFD